MQLSGQQLGTATRGSGTSFLLSGSWLSGFISGRVGVNFGGMDANTNLPFTVSCFPFFLSPSLFKIEESR